MSTFIVRAATVSDAPRLGHLREAMFRELGRHPDGGGPEFREDASAAFAEGFRYGTCEAWVAESPDGELVGSVAMLIYPRLPSPESAAIHEGYLLNVYTIPAWRNRGIAAALVDASIERARELELGRIRLHATEAGQRVYERVGFKIRVDEMELRLR